MDAIHTLLKLGGEGDEGLKYNGTFSNERAWQLFLIATNMIISG